MVRLLVLVCFAVIAARLTWLQVIHGEKFERYSRENRIRQIEIPAPRGMILDRNKQLIVDNRPTFDVQIVPQYFKNLQRDEQERILNRLSSFIDMPKEKILEKLNGKRYEAPHIPVKIKLNLSQKELALIKTHKLDLPSIEVAMEIKRTYLHGETGAHLLGYLGEINDKELRKVRKEGKRYRQGDVIGKTGIEKRWEPTLRGIPGRDFIEVDALGRRKSQRDDVMDWLQPRPSIPGKNVVLTIDQEIQEVAKKAFEDKIGGLIALKPSTGEILAKVSVPSFNPTEFARGPSVNLWKSLVNNPYKPLRDKTIQDHYAPGSVFKTLTSIAALEEGIVDENTTFFCPGSIRVGNRRYHCHAKYGHGEVDVYDALEKSCDVYYYRIAQKMDIDVLAKYAKRFGMGEKTQSGFRKETTGLIPTRAWKEKTFNEPWIPGETLSCVIGQSFVLTTMIQLANFYSALMNGGTLWKPFVVKQIESAEGEVLRSFEPEALRKVEVSDKTLKIVQEALYRVIHGERGTARRLKSLGVDMIGKTGTSQVVNFSADKIYGKCEEFEFQYRHHGLFVAVAPKKNPQIALAIVAEHACSSKYTLPIAKKVIKAYLDKYSEQKKAAVGEVVSSAPQNRKTASEAAAQEGQD